MTNEEFLIKLHNTNSREILDLGSGIPAPISVDYENGIKTYKFSSYGGQEWVYIYYISFDKNGNFINIECDSAESFC